MKPRIGIIGFPKIISLAKNVAKEFQNRAQFIFLTSVLVNPIPIVKNVEKQGMDIIIAGPGNSEVLRKHLKIPLVTLHATTRALIESIEKAKRYSNNIAILLPETVRYDLDFFERLMKVNMRAYYSRNIADYQTHCNKAKSDGYSVVIGGSYTEEIAGSMGLKGIFCYQDDEIFRNSIVKAIDLYEFSMFQMEKISQMNILLQHSNDGLLIIDEDNKISFLSKVAARKFNISAENALGQRLDKFFEGLPKERFKDQKSFEIIALRKNDSVVLDFHPVLVRGKTKGLVVVGRLVSEIEAIEKRIRQNLHKKGFEAKYNFNDLIGKDPRFKACIHKAKKYAQSDAPLLIFGETGTGKEIFAQAVHNFGPRKDFPFVAINCATLPTELIESELFGYEKGAFTGAGSHGKAGLIEFAHRGTLFLDEISALGYTLQAKLLRLLQEKEFIRIGGNVVMPIDIRVIAATNENLVEAIRIGKFRRDLYYRLSTLFLKLPPLHQRINDIPILFHFFLSQINPELSNAMQNTSPSIDKEVRLLQFPGNVRDLQNLTKRFSIIIEPDKIQDPLYLKRVLLECYGEENLLFAETEYAPYHISVPVNQDLKESLREAEKAIIKHYYYNNSKLKEIAEILGIERSTLWRKLKEYKIDNHARTS